MNFSVLNEIILAIVLGIVQGVTEFLPISSTAHQRLITALLANNRDIGLAASNFIQFGTLLAILWYFKDDLRIYFHRLFQIITNSQERKYFFSNFKSWYQKSDKFLGNPENIQSDITISQLIVGTIPILVLGYILRGFAESNRDLLNIANFLLAGSILMSFADYRSRELLVEPSKDDTKELTNFKFWEVFTIGLFQSLAAFPGISRSGATLSGALIFGKDRAKSVRFSFLLSIPALLALSVYDFIKLVKDLNEKGVYFLPNSNLWTSSEINLSILSLLIGFVLSYIFGIVFLKWLLKYLSSNSFRYFIIYRVLLATLIMGIVLLSR